MDEFARWTSGDGLDDEAFAKLLIRLTGLVTRTKRFPPPQGYPGWTDGAVEDLANGVFLAKKGRTLALKLLEKADDQHSLERLLLKTIERYLIDEAKGTDPGKLRRRLVGVLGEDARFVHLKSPETCWALADGPQQMWQGDRDHLVQAALAVHGYQILELNPSGPTSASAKKALREVSHGVLTVAAGAVRDQELAVVLLKRFPSIALVETALDMSDREGASLTGEEQGTEYQAVLAVVTESIWSSLSEEEQVAFCHVGEPAKEWAAELGLRPAAAQLGAARAAEKVALAVPADDLRKATVLELRGLSVSAGLRRGKLRRLPGVDTKPDPTGGADV